jgi:membrane protease YdiL (CAAX protease family)
MLSLAVAQVLWSVATSIWFLLGLFVYVALIRQINVRAVPVGETAPKRFGIPEAIIAALLMSLLILNLVAAQPAPASEINNEDLIKNLILTGVVVFVLLAFLAFRGFDLDAVAGLSKLGLVRAIAIAAILLFLAFPFIGVAETIVQHFLGRGSTRQNIVELFSGSPTMRQRILIIVLAVAVAPAAEELVFRFFLYGVLKRYLGIVAGLLINALLFAAVHQHLPSFVPLFVLGACFTLAYEWSGSILVPMAMHALFNGANLVFLAFPGFFDQ